jgi:hypothetical protein
MEALDGMKFAIWSQQIYRLAVFKIDKVHRKLVTNKSQVAISIVVISVLVSVMGICGFRTYSGHRIIEANDCEIKIKSDRIKTNYNKILLF